MAVNRFCPYTIQFQKKLHGLIMYDMTFKIDHLTELFSKSKVKERYETYNRIIEMK